MAECEQVYRDLMENNGIDASPAGENLTAEGVISLMREIVSDGDTYVYLLLEGREEWFEVEARDHLEILKKQVGSSVELHYMDTSDGVLTVTDVA